jgi:LAGLIDADG endonuclease
VYLTDDLIDLLNKNKILNINSFPSQFHINPINYKLVAQSSYITLTYILGVFEGDGSFYIKFLSSNSIYTFGFSITTSIEDLHILILIRLKLGCGKIEIKSKTWCRLEISQMGDLKI